MPAAAAEGRRGNLAGPPAERRIAARRKEKHVWVAACFANYGFHVDWNNRIVANATVSRPRERSSRPPCIWKCNDTRMCFVRVKT